MGNDRGIKGELKERGRDTGGIPSGNVHSVGTNIRRLVSSIKLSFDTPYTSLSLLSSVHIPSML